MSLKSGQRLMHDIEDLRQHSYFQNLPMIAIIRDNMPPMMVRRLYETVRRRYFIGQRGHVNAENALRNFRTTSACKGQAGTSHKAVRHRIRVLAGVSSSKCVNTMVVFSSKARFHRCTNERRSMQSWRMYRVFVALIPRAYGAHAAA
ncbi:MAG: hypothetical protein R3C68_18945 [Myxococcota bacterium]